jgi:hypothetical protein
MGHGHGHDAHDAHGAHGASAADGTHGPAEIPPVPATRSNSPAREAFEEPVRGDLVGWPFVWAIVAGLLLVGARTWRSPIGAHDAEHHAAEHRGAPRGTPEPGGK